MKLLESNYYLDFDFNVYLCVCLFSDFFYSKAFSAMDQFEIVDESQVIPATPESNAEEGVKLLPVSPDIFDANDMGEMSETQEDSQMLSHQQQHVAS